MEEFEIVCILDTDGIRRCFSIATDRTLMPVCQDTTVMPATDEAWYEELVKQSTADPVTNAPVIKDWS